MQHASRDLDAGAYTCKGAWAPLADMLRLMHDIRAMDPAWYTNRLEHAAEHIEHGKSPLALLSAVVAFV